LSAIGHTFWGERVGRDTSLRNNSQKNKLNKRRGKYNGSALLKHDPFEYLTYLRLINKLTRADHETS